MKKIEPIEIIDMSLKDIKNGEEILIKKYPVFTDENGDKYIDIIFGDIGTKRIYINRDVLDL